MARDVPAPRRCAQRLFLRYRAAAALLLLRTTAASAAFTCTPARDPVTCRTLGEFYAALGGAQWSQRAGWQAAAAGTGADYCAFAGVSCSADAVTSMCVLAARERVRAPPAPHRAALTAALRPHFGAFRPTARCRTT
jgi:hypothetical protein